MWMVAYCRSGLDAYTADARLALHFQMPGDAVAFDPGPIGCVSSRT
ncbi:hypothetical protein ACFQ9Z_35820 [Streptomyces sp. NPDC056580]